MKNLVELFSTSKSHYSICKFTNRQGKIAYYAEEAQDLGDFWSLHDLKTSLQHIDGDMSDTDYGEYLDSFYR